MSLISVLQFSNGAQFWNTTCVAASSNCFLWGSAPAAAAIVFVTAMFPVTKVYASQWSQRYDSNELVKNLIEFSWE